MASDVQAVPASTGPTVPDTTEDARALAQALDQVGLEQSHTQNAWGLEYHFDPPVPIAPGPIENTISVWFEPYLPHGEVTCSGCG